MFLHAIFVLLSGAKVLLLCQPVLFYYFSVNTFQDSKSNRKVSLSPSSMTANWTQMGGTLERSFFAIPGGFGNVFEEVQKKTKKRGTKPKKSTQKLFIFFFLDVQSMHHNLILWSMSRSVGTTKFIYSKQISYTKHCWRKWFMIYFWNLTEITLFTKKNHNGNITKQ